MEFIDKLNWRYATKAMNGQTVPQEKIDNILEAINLAPTSSGLQPFEVLVITNPDIKEELKGVAAGQTVVTDCSHLLVFAAWDRYTEDRINRVFDNTVELRGGTNEGLENYRQRLLNAFPKQEDEVSFHHAAKQTYIAFAHAIAAAAFEGVDSTPMEGFDANEVDRILGLRERGLKSCVMLPLGYRDEENDWLLKLSKVRKPKEEMVTVID